MLNYKLYNGMVAYKDISSSISWELVKIKFVWNEKIKRKLSTQIQPNSNNKGSPTDPTPKPKPTFPYNPRWYILLQMIPCNGILLHP